ncbi:hypothetical protein MLD38_000836 [Melastoma candidum]|uniref:Uncharacterized protein n=1 Tax=Melastoma candidum TaxID=119954 RepID=A0ACB9SAV1_9MYRT|nr:hypothetical protein MLD38_000836 [Melastoma candidum]
MEQQFEVFFKRADLDGDGRISGAEAVSFFQGSNLPKPVLAQIWMHADKAHTGFLGRAEFYNALKLVTVAQSKRDLTPEIVNAALYGPASAKIPPPQINMASLPVPNINSTSAPQMRAVSQPVPQSAGFGFPSGGQSQSVRPPQVRPLGQTQTSMGLQYPAGANLTGPSLPNVNPSNNWAGISSGGAAAGTRDINSGMLLATSKPQPSGSFPATVTPNVSKALVVAGSNGSASDSIFGGDLFSSKLPPKQELSVSTLATGASSPGITDPASAGVQPPAKASALDSLQSSFSLHSSNNQGQRPPTPSLVPSQGPPPSTLSGASVGVGNSTPDGNQAPWPKMKAADVQKYAKVFMEVDTDRDGKVTGEQARNLFLSWRLPREILKQVWDLSDQDSDSMLSLREFCFALYLMERYREGRPLPAALPSSIMYDETLLSMIGLPNVSYGSTWGPNPGFRPLQGMPGVRPMGPASGVRPGMQVPLPQAVADKQASEQESKGVVPVDPFADLDNSGNKSPKSTLEEVATTENKVEEKVILDSKEKLEFYRSKMQDLVLYKSRCDNRLNEITERASADKREAESLAKKYEEKYKQVAEIASKLTIEEATFRELQERKGELHQAIVTVERGGSADGLLQVRADRIQSDIDELMKALTDRSRKYGVEVKSMALFVLPTGWHPGIPEGAVIWDEDWDKFEDGGFGNDLSLDTKVPVSKQKSSFVEGELASPDNGFTPDFVSHSDEKVRDSTGSISNAFENESSYSHGEDELGRSPRGSPAAITDLDSSSQIFSDSHLERSPTADGDAHGTFDDSTWGDFDNNDDIDSVWGFNTKDSSSFTQRDTYSFESNDFGVNPVRTGSAPTRSAFAFDDSVPSTPASHFGNSSPRYSEAGDNYYNSFSRFDSFRTQDSGFYAQPDNSKLARFDSISSTSDIGHNRTFSSFDDSDPFGLSGPFKVSSDNQTTNKDKW